MKKTGDVVYVSGKAYELGDRIGGGMEGAVFDIVGNPNYVIKIVNTSKLTNEEQKDINEHLYWLKNTIGADKELKTKLAIPKALLDNEVGYVMVKARNHDNLNKYLQYPDTSEEFDAWFKENYHLKKRLQIAANMFRSLEQIHISGLLFTDLSPNNIMVHREKNNLVFIDTDNMRRKQDAYLGVLGTPGYMAPEIYRYYDKNNTKDAVSLGEFIPKAGKLSIESDIFSAAIIVFKLLTLQHPFVGNDAIEGTADDEDRALRCETEYVLKKDTNNPIEWPLVDCFDDCKIITSEIRDLFYRTFVDGKDNPNLRPTAIEFTEAFDNAIDKLAVCSHCGADYLCDIDHDTECWSCDKVNSKELVMYMYNRYGEANRDQLVADILGIDDDLINIHRPENRFFLLSSVVLEEKKPKFLYRRHFEETISRDKMVAVVTLEDSVGKEVSLQIVNDDYIGKCMLIDRSNSSHLIPITSADKAKVFSINQFAIIFEIKSSRVGEIKTLGCFK